MFLWVYTIPETNSSHLKMDGWKTSFLRNLPGAILVSGMVFFSADMP